MLQLKEWELSPQVVRREVLKGKKKKKKRFFSVLILTIRLICGQLKPIVASIATQREILFNFHFPLAEMLKWIVNFKSNSE